MNFWYHTANIDNKQRLKMTYDKQAELKAILEKYQTDSDLVDIHPLVKFLVDNMSAIFEASEGTPFYKEILSLLNRSCNEKEERLPCFYLEIEVTGNYHHVKEAAAKIQAALKNIRKIFDGKLQEDFPDIKELANNNFRYKIAKILCDHIGNINDRFNPEDYMSIDEILLKKAGEDNDSRRHGKPLKTKESAVYQYLSYLENHPEEKKRKDLLFGFAAQADTLSAHSERQADSWSGSSSSHNKIKPQ